MIGWLLDTNVTSELANPGCDLNVAAWARAQAEDRLFISILSLGEYDKGVNNRPIGSPARRRMEAAVGALEARFAGRIVSLDDATVRRWGRMSGTLQQATGKAPPVVDTLLAATAIENDFYLVTRNVKDVRDSGAAIFNPWNDDPAGFVLSR
ncbi:MAG: type II toxin-antitoxin system VapC family toxin [Pseudomonadota bacterium]